MGNFKRHKSRRQVRCTICTPRRYLGNARRRKPRQVRRADDATLYAAEDAAMRDCGHRELWDAGDMLMCVDCGATFDRPATFPATVAGASNRIYSAALEWI